MWSVPPEWRGETAFVICGGESVKTFDLSRLQGERVVVVNSSYAAYPDADFLLFTDRRWWSLHRHEVRRVFRGRIVTVVPPVSRLYSGVLMLRRRRGPGLGSSPQELSWWQTTLTSANDLLRWLGVARICYVGLDGRGGWHHEPHPVIWGRNSKKFELHATALRAQVEPLRAAGIEVLNLNPNSAHKMFPFASIDDVLKPSAQLRFAFA